MESMRADMQEGLSDLRKRVETGFRAFDKRVSRLEGRGQAPSRASSTTTTRSDRSTTSAPQTPKKPRV